ncbi:MAG: hypothetical protein HRT93_02955 [Piscirickettsiaceae bacterium]|nr:hypothetical protein [Piscirickettsiaceae bacterium]
MNHWQAEWLLYEKIEFDGVNSLVIVHPDVTALDIRKDVYSAAVRWNSRRENSQYNFPMRFTGLDPVPGGQTGDAYFLMNGWRLIVDLSKVAVSGILYSDDYQTAFYTDDLTAQFPATVSSLVNTVVTSVMSQEERDKLTSIPSNPVLTTDARLDNLDAPVSGSGMTGQQNTMLLELFRIMGLDPTKPLIVDEGNNTRKAGVEIDQTVETVGGVTTVTRV